MTAFEDWTDRARAVRIEDVLASRGCHLKGKIEREGPCPRCGNDGKKDANRFSINTAEQFFNCRKCGLKGRGAITLVEALDDVSFLGACATLTGEPPPTNKKGKGRKGNGKSDAPIIDWKHPEAIFDYHDRDGDLLYQNVRFPLLNPDGSRKLSAKGKPDKTFIQRRPDGNGRWTPGRADVAAVPYRLPELIASLETDRTVPAIVAEGEAKADFLIEKWGHIATSIAVGTEDFAEVFRGAHVVILPDNDKAGEERAAFVGRALVGVAASLRKLDLPDLDEGEDVLDWARDTIAARDIFAQLVDAAPEWIPPAEAPKQVGDRQRFTEDAIALVFAERHIDDLRYVASWSQWQVWDGSVWQPDDTRKCFDRSRALCREIAAECKNQRTVVTLRSAKTVAAVDRLAQSDRKLVGMINQWDLENNFLNMGDAIDGN